MNIIGIDPSMSNSGIAALWKDGDTVNYRVRHLKDIEPGDYSKAVASMKNIMAPDSDTPVYGFVEDFSNMAFQHGSTPGTIASVNYAGGLAMEAMAGFGLIVRPISVNEWHRYALGQAPKTITKTGKFIRYWTKGDHTFGVPDNIAPALLRKFKDKLQIPDLIKLKELLPSLKDDAVISFDEALERIKNLALTARRIQIAFGYSTDELEALGIAWAGARILVEERKRTNETN